MRYWILELERTNTHGGPGPTIYLVKGAEPYKTIAGSIDGKSWYLINFSLPALFRAPPGRFSDWEGLGKEILGALKEGKPLQKRSPGLSPGLTFTLKTISENEATMILFQIGR